MKRIEDKLRNLRHTEKRDRINGETRRDSTGFPKQKLTISVLVVGGLTTKKDKSCRAAIFVSMFVFSGAKIAARGGKTALLHNQSEYHLYSLQ